MNARGWVFTALILVACGGDGGPTDTGSIFDVAGSWIVTSTITGNTCQLDLEPVSMFTNVITQNATQITFTVEGISVSGTIDLETGEFDIMLTIQAEDGVITIQESGRFTSDTRYTSESSLTLTADDETCSVETNDSGERQS